MCVLVTRIISCESIVVAASVADADHDAVVVVVLVLKLVVNEHLGEILND